MSNVRYRQLDGLRAVAVAMVLYAHFFAADGSYWGHVGVRLFFVLSGFLITRLLLEARSAAEFEPVAALKSFYIRRALRIFPPYFGMLGFVWLAGPRGIQTGAGLARVLPFELLVCPSRCVDAVDLVSYLEFEHRRAILRHLAVNYSVGVAPFD